MVGASESLSSIDIIQLEMSTTPLYAGEATMCEMVSYLGQLGFELYSLETDIATSSQDGCCRSMAFLGRHNDTKGNSLCLVRTQPNAQRSLGLSFHVDSILSRL